MLRLNSTTIFPLTFPLIFRECVFVLIVNSILLILSLAMSKSFFKSAMLFSLSDNLSFKALLLLRISLVYLIFFRINLSLFFRSTFRLINSSFNIFILHERVSFTSLIAEICFECSKSISFPSISFSSLGLLQSMLSFRACALLAFLGNGCLNFDIV